MNKLPALFMAFFLMVLSSSAFVQEPAGDRVFKKHQLPVKAIAFSNNGKLLATGGEDKTVYLWDVQSGELTTSIPNAFTIKMLEFTENGEILAACGNDVKLVDTNGHLIRLWGGYTTDVWSFSYSKPKQLLVAGSYSKSVKVWDFISGKLVITLEGHERSCLPVCFSPAGNIIATGSLDRSIRLWDASTGQQKSSSEIHSENIFAIDFHPSGNYFASASADKTVRLWRADSLRVIRTFTGHKAAVFDVQFSPDGHHLLTCDADNMIILWETATGKKLYTFGEHTGAVNAVRFSPDGSGFASASDDKTVRYRKLDRKIFLANSYFEKEIEKEISGSELYTPKGGNETKQEYETRKAKADENLNTLYDLYYQKYLDTLGELTIE
jgi:WD40 repeat protein